MIQYGCGIHRRKHRIELVCIRISEGTVKFFLPLQKEWGIGGDAKAVTRTIEITMLDTMRFVPEHISVKQGETVRLKVKNVGKVMHELVIGTKQELDTHAEMMKKHPNMEHDEPYMAHVSPGKSADIIWNFNRAGQFDFACLLPGHYEAGMVGKINVIAGAK